MVMEQENQVTPKLHQGQGTRQSGGSRQRKRPSHASHSHPLGCHRAQKSRGQGKCCLGVLVDAGGQEILVLHSKSSEAEQVSSFGVQFHL